MRFYTVTQLGKHTALTPEGYLVAEGVPVARCGQQIYHHSELPLEPNQDGFVSVNRDPSEVFRAESVKSFQGKPIVNDHPMDEVGPGNWNNLAIGVMINPRRGTGADDDVLLADLLFTTPVGIQLVQSGKRAVSVGYDAHYDQIAPGMGSQKNIVCNHLALVDVARCGPRCTIMDGGAAIYNDTWKPKPPVYQRGMDILRKLLPVAWSRDVDYRQHEPIDYEPGPAWNDDDWNEALHPRVPGGSEAGGQFTSGGGGGMGITSGLPSGGFATGSATATAAQNVPTPKAAVVQKHGGSKKLAALVKQHLQMGEDPHTTAEAIKAYGNAYVNAGYASYANALLKHVEEAHGLPTGSLGKAKAALPTGKGPPAMAAPSAAEMQAMAEADEPAPDEDDEWAAEEQAQIAEQHAAVAEIQTKQVENTLAGKGAAGTNPDKLEAIANDPTALNELSDSAHKLGINVMGHPTAEAKAAKSEISTWTDPAGYKMIQNHLNGTKTSPEAAAVADKLQKAILSTSLLSSVNTYRGVHGPQLAKLQSMMPGDTWTPPGFSATTLDPKRATHYAKGGQGGDLMHIVLPKGSKALYVSNPDLNNHTAEREMLMPAGSTFKYVGAITIDLPHYDYSGNKVGNGGPVTVHQVEVMQPGSPEFEAAHPRGEGGKFVAKPGTEAEEAAHAAPGGAAEELPWPSTQSQSGVHQIFNNASWTNEQKIAAIQVKLENFSHEPNIKYAEKALQALKSGAVEQAPIASPEAMAEAETGVIPEVPSLLKKYGAISNIYGMAKMGATSSQGLEDYLQKSLAGGSIPMGGAAHGYAQAVIAAKKAQEKPGWMKTLFPEPTPTPTPAGPKVPPEAVAAIVDDPSLNHNQKVEALKNLTAAATKAGHDTTEAELGASLLAKKQEELESSAPQPDGSPEQQDMWEAALSPGLKHKNKLTQLEADIANAKEATTKEYGKQLLAHLKGETYTPPTPAAPQGPAPYAGSKGQQAIYEYATHPDPGVTTAEKIAGIKSVMAHANAGPMTQEFGEKWIEALGGDPSAPTPATPTPAPAAPVKPPSPAAPSPAAAKGPPHYKTQMKATYEDAQGNDIETALVADTKQIPDHLYQKVTAAYGANPEDGNTTAVGYAMQEAAQMMTDKLNKLEKSAIGDYKGSGYHEINDCARGTSPCSQATLNKIKRIRATLKQHVVPAHTPCFRGLRASLKDLTGFDDPEHAQGRAFVHRNFASMSRDRSVSENFASIGSTYSASTMMHVTIPAGTPGIVLGGQGKGSEAELVLPDHCVFRIDRVEVNKSGSASKHTIHCTYMGTQENKDVGQSAI